MHVVFIILLAFSITWEKFVVFTLSLNYLILGVKELQEYVRRFEGENGRLACWVVATDEENLM